MNYFFLISEPISQQDLTNFQLKSIENWTYYTDSQYSLATSDNILRYISIFPTGILPYGIEWSDNNVKIVTKLGEPDKKVSSKALGIEITYERLGISIEFCNFDWNDLDNRIKSIVVFAQLREKDFLVPKQAKICSVCKEIGGYRCSICKLFCYCSRECQTSHWKVHRAQCKMLGNVIK